MSEPMQIPDHFCPYCGKLLDGVVQANGLNVLPQNGDATVCLDCASFSIFDNRVEGGLRIPTDTEEASLRRDPSYEASLQFVRRFQEAGE